MIAFLNLLLLLLRWRRPLARQRLLRLLRRLLLRALLAGEVVGLEPVAVLLRDGPAPGLALDAGRPVVVSGDVQVSAYTGLGLPLESWNFFNAVRSIPGV